MYEKYFNGEIVIGSRPGSDSLLTGIAIERYALVMNALLYSVTMKKQGKIVHKQPQKSNRERKKERDCLEESGCKKKKDYKYPFYSRYLA